MKWLILVALLIGCRGAAPTHHDTLGAEFRHLRTVLGHFGATPGPWNDAVDRFGGRKHVVMTELGKSLGAPGTARAQVIATLGDPDEIARPGEELWSYVHPDASGSEMLVYHWRGRHDFLYFLVRDGKVLRADWWMALE